jgi:hypothetical protein
MKEKKKVFLWKPFLERCCCGSGLEADMECNEENVPCGYFCPECRDRRLKTFGIDTSKKRPKNPE